MSKRPLVLVAIDHATELERTLDLALSAARAREADVHAIQVVSHRTVHLDDRTGPRTFEPHRNRGVDIRARLATRPAGHDAVCVRSVTLRGRPERVIAAYAHLHQATMLVVERDFGSSQFWRHGRVVDELVRQSPMPLLVLPRRQRRDRREPGLRRILAPVDFSIASAVALRTAADLSRRHGARLTVLHALKDVPQHMVLSGSEAREVVRRLPAQVAAAANRLRRKAAFVGADEVDTEVATGDAMGAILETATRSDADLVVMGIAHRSWLDRLLSGSTLARVLRRATVPVLVVPVVGGAQAWPSEAVAEQISGRAWTEPAVDRVAA